MNGAFKAVSGAICFTATIDAADVIPASALPGTEPMLIILIALAVAFSLLAETIYGYLRDRDEAGWVRPELSEHAVIVRRLGGMR
jgi:hypothetical protein